MIVALLSLIGAVFFAVSLRPFDHSEDVAANSNLGPTSAISGTPTSDELRSAEEQNRPPLASSIAVLPCDNFSPDPDNAYFAAGIHEAMLSQLVKIRDLHVIARTSVLQYAGAARPITEIARELNVSSVVECSVSYAEGRVAIAAQLIDAETGGYLWSDRYNREFANIFGVQADIATAIAAALKAKLLPEERRLIQRAPTSSSEAYAQYLRALNAIDDDGNSAALVYLDQAIATDPDFALAYAQRARILSRSMVNTTTGAAASHPSREAVVQRALEDAERALTRDSTLGLAHIALARIHTFTWHFAEAHASLEQAVEASPNDPHVLREYALIESVVGDPEQAIRQGRRSVALDPANYESYYYLGLALQQSGDHAGTLAAYRQAMALNDTAAIMRIAYLGGLEARFGDAVEGEKLVRLSEELTTDNSGPGGSMNLPLRAYAYRQLGLTDDATRVFEEFKRWAADRSAGAGDWVAAYLAIGDAAQALQWLDRAAEKAEANQVDEGFWNLTYIRANIFSDPILERPEFVAARAKLASKG